MPTKRNHEDKPQRLAKGVSKDQGHARHGRTRKGAVRKIRGRNPGRTLADERELPPLARLLGALQAEKINYQVIGMSAANMQGVPGGTQDFDLWLDLPPRQYMKAVNLAVRDGAQFVRNTVVELSDGILVNFVYAVTGLPAFKSVFGRAQMMELHGLEVAVLPLDLIVKSKQAIRRPKDLLHIEMIKQRLKVKEKSGR